MKISKSGTTAPFRALLCVGMGSMLLPSALSFSIVSPRLMSIPLAVVGDSKSAVAQHNFVLKMADGEAGESLVKVKIDPIVKEASAVLRRLSWFTWWSQLILTTVSSVTLLFARNVIGAQSNAILSPSLPNFLLAGVSIGLSFCSIFWTWANRRLARRLLRKPTTPFQAAQMLRKSIKAGVTLNLFGMLTSLISAEQIVGALAIKVLTSAPARTTVALLESSSNYLQPLDILVVQASTNTLFSHFTSLAALLFMTGLLAKLDPSNDEK